MFDHVSIRVADLATSEAFYRTVLGALVLPVPTAEGEFVRWRDFSIAAATTEKPPTSGLHVAFVAKSRDAVDAFWEAGVGAGHRDDGEPGPRPQYAPDYYGGFLLDPDGNSAEAVHRGDGRRDGNVDHLWIRVSDLAAARRFYVTVASAVGLRVGADTPDRVSFNPVEPVGGTFSVLPGEPTRHLRMAFPGTRAGVDAFHASAVDAGAPSAGAPRERPEHHPGYYAAVVSGPDGAEVEVVSHGHDETT